MSQFHTRLSYITGVRDTNTNELQMKHAPGDEKTLRRLAT